MIDRLQAAYRTKLLPEQRAEFVDCLLGFSQAKIEVGYNLIRDSFTGRMPFPSEWRAAIPDSEPTWVDPYRSKIKPHHDSVCQLPEKIWIHKGPQKMLVSVSKFEAEHIECPGHIGTTCPNCGTLNEPWINPFFVALMKQFPGLTRNWNPHMKGLMLCDDCAPLFERAA